MNFSTEYSISRQNITILFWKYLVDIRSEAWLNIFLGKRFRKRSPEIFIPETSSPVSHCLSLHTWSLFCTHMVPVLYTQVPIFYTHPFLCGTWLSLPRQYVNSGFTMGFTNRNWIGAVQGTERIEQDPSFVCLTNFTQIV
jgi:hypothetical protein